MSANKTAMIGPPKTNGFSKPLHHLQMSSWIIYAYLNINFHLIHGLQTDHRFIIINIIHIILSLTMLISAYFATSLVQ